MGTEEQAELRFWLFAQVIIVSNRAIRCYQPSSCKVTIVGWVDTWDNKRSAARVLSVVDPPVGGWTSRGRARRGQRNGSDLRQSLVTKEEDRRHAEGTPPTTRRSATEDSLTPSSYEDYRLGDVQELVQVEEARLYSE
ncbi:hypothetical protein M404DRAFT_36069 [Pisolithus tinctorius Marx 270]|uniref:Uncharacterized protein n=1 Tax=Pisolithus tinctorius Marx 270 TaxID=870435 RepID=A0A0C3MX53_PISTI|nr:hypothetical protein M404DRAFT_36069 [Pisolithus tinctorius Marx 270]